MKQGTVIKHVRLGNCLITGYTRVNNVPVLALLTLQTRTAIRVYVDAEQASKSLIKGQV